MSGDSRNRTHMFKYITRRSALLSIVLLVPLLIITGRETIDYGMPMDKMTIWVIVNLSYYLFELSMNSMFFRHSRRTNR